MPIITYDSLESVPEDFKSIAKEDNGKITINVVPKASVDQFRDNNIALKKQYDELSAAFTPLKEIVGEDPEAFKASLTEWRTTAQRVKDGELKETRAIEEALGKRTDDMRRDYERQLQAKAGEANAWKDRFAARDQEFRHQVVSTAIKTAAMDPESGVDLRAIDDLTNAGLQVFRINDDGKLVAMDGDATIYGTDGTNSMTPKEWLGKLKDQKPFFFKTSQGGGASGNGSPSAKIHGYDTAQWAKLSPQQRLAAANEALLKKR